MNPPDVCAGPYLFVVFLCVFVFLRFSTRVPLLPDASLSRPLSDAGHSPTLHCLIAPSLGHLSLRHLFLGHLSLGHLSLGHLSLGLLSLGHVSLGASPALGPLVLQNEWRADVFWNHCVTVLM